jgi:intraflagellar transport protein 172
LEEQNYLVVERCYAAMGDLAKSSFFRRINKIIRGYLSNGLNYDQALKTPEVEPLLHIYYKDFKKAEKIYVSNGESEKAIQMYQELQRWDEGLRISQENKPKEFQ